MPAIYPAFERPLPGGEDSFSGNSISRCLKQHDELLSGTNTTPLSHFIDSNTIAREFIDDKQIAAMSLLPVQWYDAADGLLTVRGILATIEQRAARFHSRRGDDTERLLNELRQLEILLVAAADDANRFHLLIDV